MRLVFKAAATFNQPVDSWNVGVVTSMDDMFNEAAAFNQPVDSWNVGASLLWTQCSTRLPHSTSR